MKKIIFTIALSFSAQMYGLPGLTLHNTTNGTLKCQTYDADQDPLGALITLAPDQKHLFGPMVGVHALTHIKVSSTRYGTTDIVLVDLPRTVRLGVVFDIDTQARRLIEIDE